MLPLMLVGLTGGISTGKSTVSLQILQFSNEKYPIVDADKIAREIVEPGSSAYRKLVQTFGNEILANPTDMKIQDSPIDRAKLGRLVFGNEENRKKLNLCTHPFIIRRIWWTIFKAFVSGKKILFLDAPLLIETGLYKWMSRVIVVYCAEEIQLERLLKRNPELSEQDAKDRIAAQISIETKRKFAHFVINNERSINDTKLQVENVVKTLESEWLVFALKRAALLLLIPALGLAYFSR